VILKADDFVYESFCADGVPAGWRLYLDYVESRGLKTSVGVIGHRLAEAPPSFFALLGEMHRRGRVEFLNHGLTHASNVVGKDGVARSELKGTPDEAQRDNLRATQALLRRGAGIVLRGFGAPGNAIDATTAQVVAENEEILYWFLGRKDGGKTVLPRVADIENARLVPDYDTFRRTHKLGAASSCTRFIPGSGPRRSWPSSPAASTTSSPRASPSSCRPSTAG